MEALEAAIALKHNCKPSHKETVLVREVTKADETIWEGNVEVFELAGHSESKRCYAWKNPDGKGGYKIFTVLESHVVNSANRAVQAAIFTNALPIDRETIKVKDLDVVKRYLEDCKNILQQIGRRAERLDLTDWNWEGPGKGAGQN